MKKTMFMLLCLLFLIVGCSKVDNKKNEKIKSPVSSELKIDNNKDYEYSIKYPFNSTVEEKKFVQDMPDLVNKDIKRYPEGKVSLTGIVATFNSKEHGFVFLLINKSPKIVYNLVCDVTVTKKSDGNIMFDKIQVDFSEEEYGRLNPKEFYTKNILFSKDKQNYSDYGDGSDYELDVEFISMDLAD